MNILGGLLKYVVNYKKYIVLNILCNILMVIFSVVSIPSLIPFLRLLFNKEQEPVLPPDASLTGIESWVRTIEYQFYLLIQEEGRYQALAWVCLFIVIIFLFKNLFRYLSLYFMAPVRIGVVRDIRNELHAKYLQLPLSYHSNQKKGDLIARITSDVLEIEWSILNVLEALVRDPLMIIGCLLYMLYVSPSLTVYVFGMVLVSALLIGVIGSTLRKSSAKAQNLMGRVVSAIEESLSGLRIVKGFQAEHFRQGTFSKENNALKRVLVRIFRRKDLSSPLSEFLGITVVAGILLIGASFVFDGSMDPETFITFIFAFYSVINPAKSLSNSYYNIKKGLAASDRVNEVLDVPNKIADSQGVNSFSSLENEIEFKGVSFSYDDENEVLKKINIKIPKGKITALVGQSGSGKTTLTDLLPRFYDVSQGEIWYDEREIREVELDSLRRQFGIVSQEPVLFHDTIKENILFGRNATEEELKNAAQVANALGFIEASEKGWDTIIGDRGTKLSGGQRQRLTIARAILKNPPILILDEATSSLDTESEKLVQDAMMKIMQDRTVIIVAHRLSTIQDADNIIVLEQGKVVEQGTHKDLIRKQGVYHKLVQMQSF